MRKPVFHKSPNTVGNGSASGQSGIFGVRTPVATTMKAAGGSPGYDPWTKGGGKLVKARAESTKHATISKQVYVGNGGGATGAKSSRG